MENILSIRYPKYCEMVFLNIFYYPSMLLTTLFILFERTFYRSTKRIERIIVLNIKYIKYNFVFNIKLKIDFYSNNFDMYYF